MVTVTTEQDPVAAVIDMVAFAESVDDPVTSRWPDDGPDRTLPMGDVEPSERQRETRLQDASLYVIQNDDATYAKQDAAGNIDATYVVDVQVWTGDGDTAHAYQRALTKLFAYFSRDNVDMTPFYEVGPIGAQDFRAQSFSVGAFDVEVARVQLQEYRRIGDGEQG